MDDGYEPVHVELDWYDGPRGGLADVDGVPHYFRAVDDGGRDDEYFVWPVSESVTALEREQWGIFVQWNTRYEAGAADVGSHPGHGGVDARFDELQALLEPHRQTPAGARRLTAEWGPTDAPRYHPDGVGYMVRWASVKDDH